MFVDLSKAFDGVHNKLLLAKAEKVRIKGTAKNLLESYLTKRKQITAIKNQIQHTTFQMSWKLEGGYK